MTAFSGFPISSGMARVESHGGMPSPVGVPARQRASRYPALAFCMCVTRNSNSIYLAYSRRCFV